MLSRSQSAALMNAALVMGKDNSFPVFLRSEEPSYWSRTNFRALHVRHESTFKSMLGRGWLERLGEKSFRIQYGEPGSGEEYADLTVSLTVYGLTDLGIKYARSEMERFRYDFDASVAAGDWVLEEPAQNQA